jgi:hypothetical protein
VNFLAIEEPLGERPAVVLAGGPDGEHLGASPRQEHSFAICVTEEHRAVREVTRGNAA